MPSSGLFNRLLDLHARYPGRIPEEDFFTELVAYLFETSPATLMAWLDSLGWKKVDQYSTIRVDTQAEYEGLSGHDQGSRPDIRIELSGESGRELLFIESKLGSEEGDRQLQRYAEILNEDRSADQKWLIYITREKDPKDPGDILRNIAGSAVNFLHLRWRDFYRFLSEQPQDFLGNEVGRFMEENGMARQVRFSEVDLPALANLQHPFQLMLGVLDKEMQRRYQSVVGSRGAFTPLQYLTEDWARFALEGEIVGGGLYCIVGFDRLAAGGDPGLCIMLQVRPEQDYGTNRYLHTQLIGMMKDIQAKRMGWIGWALDNPGEYSLIRKGKHLRDLMPSAEIDDVCKAVLHEYLDDLVEIKRDYPEIAWKSNF